MKSVRKYKLAMWEIIPSEVKACSLIQGRATLRQNKVYISKIIFLTGTKLPRM